MLASLRVRLAAWLLLALSVVVAVCAWLGWRHAATVADYVQDHDLLSSAKVLSDRLIWDGDNVQASVPPSALSLFVSPEHDRVFLRVSGSAGELLAGAPGLPLPQPLALAGADQAQWYDTAFEGLALRAVVTRRAMYESGGARDITIVVAKTTQSRDQMLRALWWPTLDYLLAALLLALLVSALALTWELRPVLRLSRQLAARDPLQHDLHLDPRALHQELRPVADAVNAYARQLRAHAQVQRRFIADAAHQLRTPLALQASQIAYGRHARRQDGDQAVAGTDIDALWLQLDASNRRLIAVTNKLLLLAQAEHGDAQTGLVPLDLAAAALACVEQLAALADQRSIDLGMALPPDGRAVRVRSQASLLDALVSNLLDNALRYTPPGGRVTVVVHLTDGQAELRVEDNGPGIPAEARERVFERFHRLATDTEGSGLGLAIVREVAHAFGASVTLASHPDATPGLRVSVRFPPAP